MTSWLAHYGVIAVFFLMMIDAVFPAASELVMVYGGALASGALTHEFDVLGWHATGFAAYLAVVLAGVLGYQIGAIGGWRLGERGGEPFVVRHGRWFHLSPAKFERAQQWFTRWNDWAVFVGRLTPVARSFVSIPAGVFGSPFRRYNVVDARRQLDLVRGARGDRLGARLELGHLPQGLPVDRVRRRGGNSRHGGVSGPSATPHG